MSLKITSKLANVAKFPTLAYAKSMDLLKWLALCATGKSGSPLNNLQNVMIGLRNDPALMTAFGFDEMQRAATLMSPLPGADTNVQTFTPRPLVDHDATQIQEYLQQSGLKQVSWDLVHRAVDKRAAECPFHSVRAYFDSLIWDGVGRVEDWLTAYLGVEKTEYSTRIGCMFLAATVARIFQPGCKFDYMLVLEGPQGVGKSTVCKILGGDGYSDALPNVTGGKEEAQHLRGKTFVEIAELSVMSKADGERWKSFLSRTEERYRPPYGRKEVREPRQCVFVGTTNQFTYLKDETGGRRFWPVKVGVINIDALQKDRDQLFAEAVKLYKDGVPWHPDKDFERQHIQPEQDARYEPDPWESDIREHLDALKPDKVLIGKLLDVLGVGLAGRGRAHQNRVVSILVRLGWSRLKKDSKGNVPWAPPSAHGQHG